MSVKIARLSKYLIIIQRERKNLLDAKTENDMCSPRILELYNIAHEVSGYVNALIRFRKKEPMYSDCVPEPQYLDAEELQLVWSKLVLETEAVGNPDLFYKFFIKVLSLPRDNKISNIVFAIERLSEIYNSFTKQSEDSNYFTVTEIARIKQFIDANKGNIELVLNARYPTPVTQLTINECFTLLGKQILANNFLFQPEPLLKHLYDTYAKFSSVHPDASKEPAKVLYDFRNQFLATLTGDESSFSDSERKSIQSILTSERFLFLNASLTSGSGIALCDNDKRYIFNVQQQSAFASLSGLMVDSLGYVINSASKKSLEFRDIVKHLKFQVFEDEALQIQAAIHACTDHIVEQALALQQGNEDSDSMYSCNSDDSSCLGM